MNKIRLEILGLSSSQSQSGSFALVLGEKTGNRRLPIIIGMFEAQAIAIEIERITPNRPMTHDLFRSISESFDVKVLEVIISDLREGVFYAKLVCTDGAKVSEIDARPSDAIAIALRFSAPIFTQENVLSEAGIVLTDEEEEERETEALSTTPQGASLKNYSSEQLQPMLDEALEQDDYERAAKIRDELNKRN
ncbi:MAG: bifunctional nuclease domain-containing protein [Thermonemataceae bacterium]